LTRRRKAQVGKSQEKLQQALMKWKTFRRTGSLPFFLPA
jgi:DNA polymerase IIIc chi subunit